MAHEPSYCSAIARNRQLGVASVGHHRVRERASHVLSAAPWPQTDWNVELSFTTMSASAIGPGLTKLMGFGLRFEYVNSWERSQVVVYCASNDAKTRKGSGQR